MTGQLATDPTTPSDPELIAAVRGGDGHAYGLLFERHRAAALNLARQIAGSSDADDLVSDAFIKVLRVLSTGGGPDIAFRAYLLTAVRRLHIDRIRAASKVTPSDNLEEFDPGIPFSDPAVDQFENAAAAKAFASLPERWQLVLWHIEVEGQKPADVAPLLGLSANSVSALAHRAREGLRQAYLQMHLADTSAEQCRWVTERLGAHVRKGLSRRDAAKVDAHLDECPRCAAVYLELTEVNSNLSAIIAPLLLGSAAVGYLASLHGSSAVGAASWLLRLRHGIHANGVAVGGAAAGSAVAIAVAAAVVISNSSHSQNTADDGPGGVAAITTSATTSAPIGSTSSSSASIGPDSTTSKGSSTGPTSSTSSPPPGFLPPTYPASTLPNVPTTPVTTLPTSPATTDNPTSPSNSTSPTSSTTTSTPPTSPTTTPPTTTTPPPTTTPPTTTPPTSTPPTTTPPTTTPPPDPGTIDVGAGVAAHVWDDTNGDGLEGDVGDTVVFTLPVSNPGGDTLVALSAGVAKTASAQCGASTLPPGGSTTCTATFVVELSDVTNGGIDGEVTLTATNKSDGHTVRASKQVKATTEIAVPAIELTAVVPAVSTGALYAVPGDKISWTMTVTNSGNVSLTELEVAVIPQTRVRVTCDAKSLAPGASTSCSTPKRTPYVVTGRDVGLGSVDTDFTAHAQGPEGDVPSQIQSTSVPVIRVGVDASVKLAFSVITPGVYSVTLVSATQAPATDLRLVASATQPVLNPVLVSSKGWACATDQKSLLDCTVRSAEPAVVNFTGVIAVGTTITVTLETPGNVDPNPDNNTASYTF